jgi:hypothetical protein
MYACTINNYNTLQLNWAKIAYLEDPDGKSEQGHGISITQPQLNFFHVKITTAVESTAYTTSHPHNSG